MANSSCFLTKLRDSREANVFPLTAAAVFVLAGLVGGGVDISRAYMVQNRLQNACDSGVLAGRREVADAGFTTGAQNAANNYFNVNFQNEAGTTGTTFTPTTPNGGDTINGTATTTLNTTIMTLFGFEEIPLSVTCTATMSVGNSDVVMVLDSTGSMSWDLPGDPEGRTRMEALQDAMKNFRTTLAAATIGSNARIRYGFVPYANTVNLGSTSTGGLLQPAWLADTMDLQSRVPKYQVLTNSETTYEDPVSETTTETTGVSSGGWWYHSFTGYSNSTSCLSTLPADESWSNYGSPTTSTNTTTDLDQNRITTTQTSQEQRRRDYACGRVYGTWYQVRRTQFRYVITTNTSTEEAVVVTTTTTVWDGWRYMKREGIDVSGFKTGAGITFPNGDVNEGTGPNGSNRTYTWNGCIEERDTIASNSISFTPGFGVSPSGMNDLDIDSTPTSDAMRWKPMIPEMAYYRNEGNIWDAYKERWVPNFVSNAEYHKGGKSQVACPVRSQLLAEMDQTAFDAYADSLTTDGGTYHSIGMIWGARLASPEGLFADNVNEEPDNESSVARHIIFMTDGELDTGRAIYSSWGVEGHDRRVTGSDGSSAQNDARHLQRFTAACEIARSKGIRVWVVAFNTLLTPELEACASTDSAFDATTADGLNTAFQEIAREVGELRVTQ